MQLMCLTESAVLVGATIHAETFGASLRAQQGRDEPGAYTKPLRYQAYRNFMAWR